MKYEREKGWQTLKSVRNTEDVLRKEHTFDWNPRRRGGRME